MCRLLTEICSRDRIFFDGFLPSSKESTRLNRIDQAVKNLTIFHAKYVGGLPLCDEILGESTQHSIDFDERQILDAKPIPQVFAGRPDATFLVPAVIEALEQSKYSTVTGIVPGEADPYCAWRVRKAGGTILTADSDLLVYDLGQNGSVIFFSQLNLQELQSNRINHPPCPSILAHVFEPYNIANALSQPDLVGLAYMMEKHPSMTVRQILDRYCKPFTKSYINDYSEDFLEFEDTYKTTPSTSESLNFEPNCIHDIQAFSMSLDPRFMEVVLQMASPKANLINIYLPHLLEDPSKASAWLASAEQRSFAYACLQDWWASMPFPDRPIYEYIRNGQQAAPHRSESAHMLQKTEIYADSISDLFKIVGSHFRLLQDDMRWRLISLRLTLNWYEEVGKTPPSLRLVEKIITGTTRSTWSWEAQHLFAQIQAMLYSLRMIKQSLNSIKSQKSQVSLPHPLTHLLDQLGSLPCLEKLMLTRLELLRMSSTLDLPNLRQKLLTFIRPETVQTDDSFPINLSTELSNVASIKNPSVRVRAHDNSDIKNETDKRVKIRNCQFTCESNEAIVQVPFVRLEVSDPMSKQSPKPRTERSAKGSVALQKQKSKESAVTLECRSLYRILAEMDESS